MIILIGQTKGGVGKSLLAANVAVALAHKGKSVVLLDADSQKTSARWAAIRKERGTEPAIRCMAARIGEGTPQEYRDKINALRSKCDVIVIDSGGFDSQELRVSLAIADVLLAPCGPTVSEIWGLADMDELVGQSLKLNKGLRSHIVINRSPPLNFHGQTEQATRAMEGLTNLTFSGLVLTDRQTYQATYQDGFGIADLTVDSTAIIKARLEIRRLVRLIEAGDLADAA